MGDIKMPGENATLGKQSSATLNQQISSIIDKFYPKRYRDLSPDESRLISYIL